MKLAKKILIPIIAMMLSFVFSAGTFYAAETKVPTEEEAYESIIALKDEYPEGMKWNNADFGAFHGGYFYGGYGCAGFAFILSDEAFGDLPAVMLDVFDYDDIMVGDILRINDDTHSVVVLATYDDRIVITEGNYNNSIHWGRELTKDTVMATTDYVMTRYQTHVHEYDDGVVTLEPSCEAGEITYSCKTCMDEYIELIQPVSDHVFPEIGEVITEPTCTKEGLAKYTCTQCNWYFYTVSLDKVPHTKDDGTVVTEPTTDSTGIKEYRCMMCKEVVETETLYYDASDAEGWIQLYGTWYYYQNGEKLSNSWLWYNGNWYYLNETGAMLSDAWFLYKNNWYYLTEGGQMATGWAWDGANWYYMNESGAMLSSSWLWYGNNWYYLTEGGQMATGWAWDGSNWYYMNKSGVMQSDGWLWDGSNWYYLHENGAMLSNSWLWYGNNWYYLTKGGQMATDWVSYNSNWYYMNDDGIMLSSSWLWDGDNWYYLYENGVMLSNTWLLDNDKWYYLETNGAMATEKWIGDYYVTASGAMATNQWVDNNTYYVDGSGHVVTNVHKIDLGNGNYTTVYGDYNIDFANEVISLVNEYRIENGLNALGTEDYLSKQTNIRGYEISYSFSHTRPNETSCFTVLSDGGYGWMGENIASGHRTPQQVFDAWKNSPGHNANMLNENFELIGVSCFVEKDTGRCHWVQMFASK